MSYNNKYKKVGGYIMSKKKRLIIITIVLVLVGAILFSSGTLQIHPGNLVNWFSSVGTALWSKAKDFISLKDILFIVVSLLIGYKLGRRSKAN